jgi:NADPH-dependent glutamate synthase beta subunit-like oxidoreductase
MRSGIPAFRLPPDVLDREIGRIELQGVEILTGKKVTVSELEGSYSAIITAVGSHIGSGLRLGNDEDVTDGIAFLRAINIHGKRNSIARGDHVAVIGGGNTAVDVARTVLRLGGNPVIYYRRTRNEMPAIAEEVEEAMKEGVPIEFLTAPVGLEKGTDGQLNMTMQRMEMGEPDESGRRRPVPVEGSEMSVSVDRIITAIGQWPDDHVFSGKNIAAGQGRLDPALSGIKTPVFCAGDMAWGGTVVEAIGSGNDVAGEVDAFLRDREYVKPPKSRLAVLPGDMNFAYYMRTPGYTTPMLTPDVLLHNFDEVAGGLDEDIIMKEADRCLHCGECYSCGNCLNFCPDAAIFIDEENRLRINFDYCKGCGICVHECPCSAIAFAAEGKTN